MSTDSKYTAENSHNPDPASTDLVQVETDAIPASSSPDTSHSREGGLVAGLRLQTKDEKVEALNKEIRVTKFGNLFGNYVCLEGLPEPWRGFNSRSVSLLNGSGASVFRKMEKAHALARWYYKQPAHSPFTELKLARHGPTNVASRAACSFLMNIERFRRTDFVGIWTTEEKLKILDRELHNELKMVPEDTGIPEVLVVRHFVSALLYVLPKVSWWRCSSTILLDGFDFPPVEKGPDQIHLDSISPASKSGEELLALHRASKKSGGKNV